VLTLAQRHGLDLAQARVGIIGVGAVGEHVRQVCAALGVRQVLLCDPPRERRGDALPWSSLTQVLDQSDIVTVHVPLIRQGPDETLGMLDDAALSRLPEGAVVLNAARGAVLPGDAILKHRDRLRFALDVWPQEPSVAPEYVAAAQLGTPHVAGHSLDAKVQGTYQIYRAACAFLGQEPRWSPGPQELPRPQEIQLQAQGRPWQEVVLEAVRASYRVEEDVRAMEALAALPEDERGLAFRRWRQSYPPRREFAATRLRVIGADERTRRVLGGLGFCLGSL
jgi:erythronate-4-phosphate dehydrogenase